MREFPSLLCARLEQQQSRGLERTLSLPRGVDFCSNDYLGFSNDPELARRIQEATRDLPVGSTGSRLLRGHTETHGNAEHVLARFCGAEAALLYPSGYQANVGLFSALLNPSDRVYSDEFNHASIIDGIRLSGCTKRVYRHVDLDRLETLLKEDENTLGLKLIVTESLFSMEGDFAPLRDLVGLARRYGAELIVDEAHTTGVFGSGLVSSLKIREQVLATVHTGGKALGVSGAWVAGSKRLKEYLVNFSRGQIFSTAISPWLAASLEAAVSYFEEVGKERSEALQQKIRKFASQTGEITECGQSPIISWIAGTPQAALEAAVTLQAQGFDVRAIRPPTVPENLSRLRITLKCTNTDVEIEALGSALLKLGRIT